MSIWSLVALARQTDLAALRARFDPRLPVRGMAAYALALTLLNTLVWMRTIVAAMLDDEPAAFLDGSGMTTNPVFVQDLAVWLPLLAVSAWWLWRRQPWGELVVGAMLTMLVFEAVGVATDQWFGLRADPDTAFATAAAIPLFVALAVVGCVPLYFYYRNLDRAPLAGHV